MKFAALLHDLLRLCNELFLLLDDLGAKREAYCKDIRIDDSEGRRYMYKDRNLVVIAYLLQL